MVTRINCVPPELLSDDHLLAEYREMPRIFQLVEAAEARGERPSTADLPDEYTMGEGHVRFFYDKLFYIAERHQRICEELDRRGFNLNFTGAHPLLFELNPGWLGDWEPSEAELLVNWQRIYQRE